MSDEFYIDETYFDPHNLGNPELETIRRIARSIMESRKVCYTKAVIIAYIEWLSMAAVENQRH